MDRPLTPAPPKPSALLDLGLADIADRYDLILCDIWGVIHNGMAHHPAAVDALRRFREQGGTVVLITNAPAPAWQVQARMDRLAVPRDAYDAIATSGDVTIGLIVEAGCPPLFNLGPGGEIAVYTEAGRLGPRSPALVAIERADLVIGIGLTDEIGERPEDYDGLLRRMRDRDLTFICANPDIVVEMGDRLEYCAGAIAERYEAIGGRVIQAGKPFAPIYDRAWALAGDRARTVPKARVLAIGDSMHTDISGAAREGVESLFVTSGIHRAALHGSYGGADLDHAALHRFLDERTVRPTVAMPTLQWRVT